MRLPLMAGSRALLIVCGLMGGCDRTSQPAAISAGGPAVPELASLSSRQQTWLDDWLFCHECTDGERDSARVEFQNDAASLDRLLTRVPVPWVDTMRVRLERIAADLALDSAAALRYRDHYLENFRATIQSRSAQLLGDIATPPALDALWRALDSAPERGYRSDVVRLVTSSLLSGAKQGGPHSVPDSVIQHLSLDSLPPMITGMLLTGAESPAHAQYFRLSPPEDAKLSAHVEWTNASAVRMTWSRCGLQDAPDTTIIPPSGSRAIDETNVVSGGDCVLLGLVKADSVTPATVYRLRLSRPQ